MSDVDTLYQYAQQYLAVVLEALALTDAGVPDGPAYVAPSIPSLDCPEGVTVHVQTIQYTGTSPTTPPGAVDMRAAWRNMIQATLVAQFWRCQPLPNGVTPNMPSAAEMNAAAKKADQDVWSVWNFVTNRIRQGVLFNGHCPPNGIDPPAPVLAQGGSAGWAFQVRPQIDGYDIPIASP